MTSFTDNHVWSNGHFWLFVSGEGKGDRTLWLLNKRTYSYRYYSTFPEWFPANLWLPPEERHFLLRPTGEPWQSSFAGLGGCPTKRPGSPRPRGWRPIGGRSGTPAGRRTLCCRTNRLEFEEDIAGGWQRSAKWRPRIRGHRQTTSRSFLSSDVPMWRRPRPRGPLLWPWPLDWSSRLICSRSGRDEARGCERRSSTNVRPRDKPNELIRLLRSDTGRLWRRRIESSSSWFLWQRSEDKGPAEEQRSVGPFPQGLRHWVGNLQKWKDWIK